MNIVDLYTDGSISNGQAIWAFIVVQNNKEVYKERGKLDKTNSESWQINGELQAIMQGLLWCKRNGCRATIFYDLKAAYLWVCDFFSAEKPWRTNKDCTKEYREFILNHAEFVSGWQKVKAHSGNYWNTEVDAYAKASWS